MSYLLTVIAFIVIFSILILVHEFGHFIMAKRAGIKVEEFGFGLPPRIWGKKKGETIYSINWIPFGGFVRMLGEDQSDPKLLKNKRTFAAQPMRSRILVVVAGVFMNFLLAWILMFIGFTAGMKPLLGPDDVLSAVNDGQIVLDQGVKIKSVDDDSIAAKAGFKAEDLIYSINGYKVDDNNLSAITKDPAKNFGVVRDGKIMTLQVPGNDILKTGAQKLGLGFYDFGDFPRVRIYDLKPNTVAYHAGLRSEDIILTINGQQIFGIPQYETLIRGVPKLEYTVFRDGLVQTVIVERTKARQVIISGIIPDSPAEKAGLKNEDVILTINGKQMTDSQEVVSYVQDHKSEQLAYMIDRGGVQLFYEIKPDGGHVGIMLSELMSYVDDQGVSLYNTDQLASVREIKDVQYPFYIAAYKSLGETWKMSVTTAQMFTNFVGGLVRRGEIPATVSGPIGIAQMTHTFVEEGFIPLLRFVAVLSLSLAVINILPFPALDGGRLLFIIIELVIGRKVNQRFENYIHALGYFLIMALILVVTYSDIMKLFHK
ncbi:MAG: RIP metalloprotease RseP [Candidatus Peregrinibacteria bacterium]|nr:RIP metalloprotease RseP [Candidatus Peregrinibacteria bacterium]